MIEELPCGGLYQIKTEVKGNISFWQEEQYDNDLDCEWYMEIPQGSLFSITYLRFNLEASDDDVCSTDYVLIRGGNNDASGDVMSLPILAKQCGANIPLDLLVQANKILITFHSDGENQYRGFRLSYSIIKGGIPN